MPAVRAWTLCLVYTSCTARWCMNIGKRMNSVCFSIRRHARTVLATLRVRPQVSLRTVQEYDIECKKVVIGIDLGDKFSHMCVLDVGGRKIEESRLRTTKPALRKGLAKYSGARVILETSIHSPWISRLLDDQTSEVHRAAPT